MTLHYVTDRAPLTREDPGVVGIAGGESLGNTRPASFTCVRFSRWRPTTLRHPLS